MISKKKKTNAFLRVRFAVYIVFAMFGIKELVIFQHTRVSREMDC